MKSKNGMKVVNGDCLMDSTGYYVVKDVDDDRTVLIEALFATEDGTIVLGDDERILTTKEVSKMERW